MNFVSRGLMFAAAALGWCTAAEAAPVIWTDWTNADLIGGTASGSLTVGGTIVDVTYRGELASPTQTSGGTNYWNPPDPYVSGAVDNAPPASDIIAINTAGLRTFVFSMPVVDPFIAIVSLNGGNAYEFGVPVDIISFGSGYWGDGTLVPTLDGNGVTSTREGHGVIRLQGTFKSITFNATEPEHWNGFTIGVRGLASEDPPVTVPEPATLGLLGAGLIGIMAARHRSRRRAA